jgi:hypothetical protein
MLEAETAKEIHNFICEYNTETVFELYIISANTLRVLIYIKNFLNNGICALLGHYARVVA